MKLERFFGEITSDGKTVIGKFNYDDNDDTVDYILNGFKFSLSLNAFETMCEALGYELNYIRLARK